MTIDALTADAIRIASLAKEFGITQKQISEAIGADQSQVSRVLSGKSKRRSRVFVDVCKYVNQHASPSNSQQRPINPELISALSSVWDGTPDHAVALANVIRSLGGLTNRSKVENVA